MKNRYICKECGEKFLYPSIEKEVIGDSDKISIIEYNYCPCCDSSNIEQIEVEEYEE